VTHSYFDPNRILLRFQLFLVHITIEKIVRCSIQGLHYIFVILQIEKKKLNMAKDEGNLCFMLRNQTSGWI